MLKEVTKKLEGNDRFEGYAIELMQGIAGILHFNVTFKLVDDGKYGGMDEHGNWNGMMKEVLEGVDGTDPGADFAVADLSITSQRCVLNFLPIHSTQKLVISVLDFDCVQYFQLQGISSDF